MFESPITILCGGLFLVVAFVMGVLQTGKSSLYVGAGISLLLTVGLLIIERRVITPREEVRATIDVIEYHLEQNDSDAVVDFISASKPELRREAERKMSLVEIEEVSIKSNLKIEVAQGRGGQVAEATFNAVIRVSDNRGLFDGQSVPRFFVVRFLKEDDGVWRIRSYEMRDPREGI